MQPLFWLEALLVFISVSLLAGYHVVLIKRVRRKPRQTAIGLAREVRQAWIESVMTDQRDILAVQTLRNWIMAASFLASTAILITLGLLNLMTSDKAREMLHTLNLTGPVNSGMWSFKLLILLVGFLFAFLNFSFTLRYFNHAIFMITLPPESDAHITTTTVVNTLNQGSLHYTLGMRGYYLAIPSILWLFGPVWMLLGTGVLVLALAKLDHST